MILKSRKMTSKRSAEASPQGHRGHLAATVGLVLTLGLLVAQLNIGPAVGRSSEFKGLERLRDVTGAFNSEPVAAAAGFSGENEPCVESPGGGMGIHYVNQERIQDGVIDRSKPEILLYEPTAAGEPKLVGIEYLKVDEDQDLETDDDRPSLFGRPFDGPMEGHGPGMPIHYDLHVWAWKSNPAGMFAPFNPNVSC